MIKNDEIRDIRRELAHITHELECLNNTLTTLAQNQRFFIELFEETLQIDDRKKRMIHSRCRNERAI